MSYTIYGETFTGAQGSFPMNDVKEHVRKTHLDLAASFASIVYDGMFERIDDYYGILHQKEGELNEYGYDVAGSPVGFWYTEGRAAHEAEQLEIELNKPNPDPDVVERYTAGLAKIAENVYGDPHNPGDPLRDLSPEEAAYLEEFYNTLSPEAFALLSGQGGPGGGADVGMAAENEAMRYAGFENAGSPSPTASTCSPTRTSAGSTPARTGTGYRTRSLRTSMNRGKTCGPSMATT